MSSRYTLLGTASIYRTAYAPVFAAKCLGFLILGSVLGLIAYSIRKPAEQGPDDYAEPFGDVSTTPNINGRK